MLDLWSHSLRTYLTSAAAIVTNQTGMQLCGNNTCWKSSLSCVFMLLPLFFLLLSFWHTSKGDCCMKAKNAKLEGLKKKVSKGFIRNPYNSAVTSRTLGTKMLRVIWEPPRYFSCPLCFKEPNLEAQYSQTFRSSSSYLIEAAVNGNWGEESKTWFIKGQVHPMASVTQTLMYSLL